jgi:hypothetical protein
MAQLSRPYQIALVALAVLALVWFVALRHPAGESSSSSAPSAPAAASSSGGSSAGTSSVYHGSAPGVEGLTKDIAKAHQAVAQSQHNAQELQRKSAQASGEATSGGAASSAAAGAVTHGSASRSSSATATRAKGSAHASAAGADAEAAPRAAALESELTRGKVGVVLFWNPKASDDRRVHEQLKSISHGNRRIALQVANSKEASAFGQFTRTVQVLSTPTVLIVNRQGQVTTLTGLTDTFSVRQAIGDATKGASRVQAPRFTSWTPTSSRKQFIEAANRVCRRAAGPSRRELQSLGSAKARIAALATTVAVTFRRVEGLHMPTQDRPFIHHQFSLMLAALRRESAPLHGIHPRQAFLEGEAAGDEVYNSLRAYGLYSCI